MENQNFTTTLLVDQTPEEAFNAINNVRGWWTGEGVEGVTDKTHDEFTYHYKDVHYSKQKLIELIPGKKIVWLVTESKLNFIKDNRNGQAQKLVLKSLKRVIKPRSDSPTWD